MRKMITALLLMAAPLLAAAQDYELLTFRDTIYVNDVPARYVFLRSDAWADYQGPAFNVEKDVCFLTEGDGIFTGRMHGQPDVSFRFRLYKRMPTVKVSLTLTCTDGVCVVEMSNIRWLDTVLYGTGRQLYRDLYSRRDYKFCNKITHCLELYFDDLCGSLAAVLARPAQFEPPMLKPAR